jgi:Putative zinc-finger
MTMECEDVRVSLGVYVLGAIDPAERSMVDAHLNACPSCRDELAGMAGLPALLGRVGEAQIAALAEPSDELLEPLLARAAAGRRSRFWWNGRRDGRWRGPWSGRWTPLIAAAAVALMVGALFGGFLGGFDGSRSPAAQPSRPPETRPGPSSSQKAEELYASDPRTGASARLVVTRKQSGTEAELHLRGVPPGSHCRLEAVDGYGRRDSMGSWEVAYRGYGRFTGSTMFRREQVTSFEIVTDDGRTLLVIPA